jgi:carbohydrate-binding DOMON domain-containing protein
VPIAYKSVVSNNEKIMWKIKHILDDNIKKFPLEAGSQVHWSHLDLTGFSSRAAHNVTL